MGLAKLNVWIRDEQGKVCVNTSVDPRYDWVKIWYPDDYPNSLPIKKVNLPKGLAHVEVEIPPGVYIVQGHFCELNQLMPDKTHVNEATDRAFVTASCGQEICLNLIVPNFVSCVHAILNPLINVATMVGIKDTHIQLATATLLAAAKIPKENAIKDFEARKVEAHALKATEMVKTYDNTLKILKDLPVIK